MHTKRIFALAAVAAVLSVVTLSAVGTATWTRTNRERGLFRYSVAWTSTAGGAVSANAETVLTGYLQSMEFVPCAAADAPTDMYDITLINARTVDILAGAGANLLAATATRVAFDPPPVVDGTLDLVVANAGDTNCGTAYLWIQIPIN